MFYCPRLDFAFTRLFPIIGFQIITETSSLEDLPCLERDKHSIRLNHSDRFPQLGNNYRRADSCSLQQSPFDGNHHPLLEKGSVILPIILAKRWKSYISLRSNNSEPATSLSSATEGN